MLLIDQSFPIRPKHSHAIETHTAQHFVSCALRDRIAGKIDKIAILTRTQISCAAGNEFLCDNQKCRMRKERCE